MCVEHLKYGSLAYNRVSNLVAYKIGRKYNLFLPKIRSYIAKKHISPPAPSILLIKQTGHNIKYTLNLKQNKVKL